MLNQYNTFPEFNLDSYKAVKETHEEMKEAMNEEEIDQDKITKLYLKEMNQAMMLGGQFKKNYGQYGPY